MSSDHTSFLFVVSAPSGCGKTTLLKALLNRVSELGMSVSHTTRKPRVGELDSIDYHFIDRMQFTQMLTQGMFIEHATVHGNMYGTSFLSIQNQLDSGLDVVLDIDIQGMASVKAKSQFDIVSLFIIPPSLADLESRLRNRKLDTDFVIKQRLANSVIEIQQARTYDYILLNQDFDAALDGLVAIVLSERSRSSRSLFTGKFF